MKYVLLTIMISVMLTGCATLKKIGRTTNDVASMLCNIFAEENVEQLQGLSPTEWCAIHENLKPFIEYVLTAKQAAGAAALGNQEESE